MKKKRSIIWTVLPKLRILRISFVRFYFISCFLSLILLFVLSINMFNKNEEEKYRERLPPLSLLCPSREFVPTAHEKMSYDNVSSAHISWCRDDASCNVIASQPDEPSKWFDLEASNEYARDTYWWMKCWWKSFLWWGEVCFVQHQNIWELKSFHW